MPHRDLRAFLEALEQREDLLRLTRSIHPRLEAAAVLRRSEESGGPALLLEKVTGTPIPVAGNLFASDSRLRLALEIEGEVRAGVADRLGRRIPPRPVGEGPVREVVRREGIDLERLLPGLTYHSRDKGPFITTGILLFRDPREGQILTSIHRMQVQEGNLLSAQIVTPLLARWVGEASREDFPVIVILGVEPGFFLGSVLQESPRTDRLESIGGLRGEAVEVVEALGQDLPVPAHAELVLEGRVLAGRRVAEGPMGESTGVYTTNRSHLIRVDAVSHRSDHIAHALVPWSLDEEALVRTVYAVPMELHLRDRVPAVRQLHLVPGTCATHAVIAIQKSRQGQARDLIPICLELFPKLKQLVVVDEDVDPTNPRMVSWALATRFQADRDLVVLPPVAGFAIDPSARRSGGEILTAPLGMDATMPPTDRKRFERIEVGERASRRAQRILPSVADR